MPRPARPTQAQSSCRPTGFGGRSAAFLEVLRETLQLQYDPFTSTRSTFRRRSDSAPETPSFVQRHFLLLPKCCHFFLLLHRSTFGLPSQGGQNAGVVKKKKSPAQTKHTEDVGRGTACGTLLRINAPSTPVYITSDEFCGRCARRECARNRNPFHLCREAHVRAPLSAPVAHIHGKEPASAMPCSFP